MKTRLNDMESKVLSRREMDPVRGGAGNGKRRSETDIDLDFNSLRITRIWDNPPPERYPLPFHNVSRKPRVQIYLEVGYDLNPEFDLDDFSLRFDPEIERFEIGLTWSI